VPALDLDLPVVPADGRVQVTEDAQRAARRQAPGPNVDVGLEHRPDRWPPGRQRAVPVGAHLLDQDLDEAPGVVQQRHDLRGRRVAREAPGDLLGDALGRRGAHARELALQVGQRCRRRR
jgi:hypothetical protein